MKCIRVFIFNFTALEALTHYFFMITIQQTICDRYVMQSVLLKVNFRYLWEVHESSGTTLWYSNSDNILINPKQLNKSDSNNTSDSKLFEQV